VSGSAGKQTEGRTRRVVLAMRVMAVVAHRAGAPVSSL
jgi:hypothetical protein